MSKIIITGGKGLVGKYLTNTLLQAGHDIVHLSRAPGRAGKVKSYLWNPAKGFIDVGVFDGATTVVHLAGAPIAAHRWTKAYKMELYESRVRSTRLLVQTIQQNGIRLHGFISASAVGIYGLHPPLFTYEREKSGTDFLATLCADWENEAKQLGQTRVVMMRTGVVLAKESGLIPKMSTAIRLGAGAVLGNGGQFMSWIHIDDLVALYTKAITDANMRGAYNAVSPHPQTNKVITLAMASKLNRPIVLPPIPPAVLRVLLGEISSTVLASQHISCELVEQTGFKFRYPHLQIALDNLL